MARRPGTDLDVIEFAPREALGLLPRNVARCNRARLNHAILPCHGRITWFKS